MSQVSFKNPEKVFLDVKESDLVFFICYISVYNVAVLCYSKDFMSPMGTDFKPNYA